MRAGEVIHLAAISIVCKRLRLCESFYVGFWRVLPFLRLGLIPLARWGCRALQAGEVIHLAAISIVCGRCAFVSPFMLAFGASIAVSRPGLIPLAR